MFSFYIAKNLTPTRVYTCICSKLFFIFKTLWLGNNSPASLGSENDLDLSCSALDIPKVEKDSNRIRTPLKEMTNHNVIPKKIILSSLSPPLSSCSPPSQSSDTPQLQQSFFPLPRRYGNHSSFLEVGWQDGFQVFAIFLLQPIL